MKAQLLAQIGPLVANAPETAGLHVNNELVHAIDERLEQSEASARLTQRNFSSPLSGNGLTNGDAEIHTAVCRPTLFASLVFVRHDSVGVRVHSLSHPCHCTAGVIAARRKRIEP
jgi:hypothetical protein